MLDVLIRFLNEKTATSLLNFATYYFDLTFSHPAKLSFRPLSLLFIRTFHAAAGKGNIRPYATLFLFIAVLLGLRPADKFNNGIVAIKPNKAIIWVSSFVVTLAAIPRTSRCLSHVIGSGAHLASDVCGRICRSS